MSLLHRLKAFTSAKWLQSSMVFLSGGKDSKRPDFDYRQAVAAYRSWVYAAANLNAVAVASVPLRLYIRNTGGAKLWNSRRANRREKAYLAGRSEARPSRYALRKAAEFGDDYQVVEDSHPLLNLLSKVNPYFNGYDMTVLRILHTELTGNAYIHPVIDKTLGVPVELWPMLPQFVEIIPGQKGSASFIEGYRYGVKSEQAQTFAPEEVIHFKRPNPANLYYGIGKVEAAWGAVLANAAIHEMDLAFFENKGRPDWLLTIKTDASPEEVERLEVQIDEKLRGKSRTGRFLTATADIDVKPLSFPPKDLMGRSDIVEEIAAVFGVPVSMLKANDPNLASATTGFATWKETTILPMLRMDEEVLNQNLLPLFGIEDDAFVAYDNPVMEDERFLLEERRTAVAGGWRTANEARKEEGREPIEDPAADRLLVNGMPLGGPPAPAPLGLSANPDGLVGPLDVAPDADDPPSISQNAAITFEPMPEAKDALSDCVSEKIPKLIDEGYPQDQAVAIAYSMCADGKSFEDAISELERDEGIREKALSDIDTKPPQTVADNARRALEVRATKPESERGMTAVGLARARDLSNRKPLSEETIRRMAAYFERHEVDKQGESWDQQGKGWQAWNGWGGDDGWAWARRKVEQFDREREKRATRIEKSCGCEREKEFARSLEACFDECIMTDNCGVGPEGFEQGNECGAGGGGGGGSSEPSSEKPAASDKPKKPSSRKPAAEPGKPPAANLEKPKQHDVSLPKNPRRMTIDQFDAGLSALGYSKVSERTENPYSRTERRQYFTVRDSAGNTAEVEMNQLLGTMYANSKDPALRAVTPKPRSKSCGCGCAGGESISQKSLWDGSLAVKARKPKPAAELEAISEDEKAISRVVDRVLRRQVAAVLKEIRSEAVPTAEMVAKVEQLISSARWDREVVAALSPYLKRSLLEGIKLGEDAIKAVATDLPKFELKSPQLEAYAESESVRLSRGVARGVNRYTRERVSDLLGDGIQKGETVDQLAERVQDWAGKQSDDERSTLSRARTIARTEAMRASRAAEVEAWKASGIVEGKSWLLAPDPCEFCEAAAAQFGEKSIGVGDPFYRKGDTLEGADGGSLALDYEAIDGPPLHPNCRCSLVPKLVGDYAEVQAEIDADLEAELAAIRKANP